MKRQHFAYEKLAQILRAQIVSGFIKPGEYIMSENELCKHYGLSRTSVRKAMDILSKEGLIVRSIGQGTMVPYGLNVQQDNRKTLHIMRPFASHFGDNGLSVIIEQFTQLYPHVEVKVLSLPRSNFWESLRECGEMGLHPDLVLSSDRQFKEIERPGAYENVSSLVHPHEDSVYARLLDAFRYGNELKAVPVTFSPVYLAYNPELFRKYDVPIPEQNWTFESFLRAAKQLTRDSNGDGIVDTYGFSMSSSSLRWPVFALQNDVDFANPASRPEHMLQTVRMLHNLLYHEKAAAVSQQGVYRVNSDAFIRNKAAMVLTTTFEMASWMNEEPDFVPEAASMPFGDKDATLLMVDAIMISPMCKDIDLAKQFIRIAIDRTVQEKMSRETDFLSIHRNVNENIWDPSQLRARNIGVDLLENCYYVYDLFPDVELLEELESEMEMFWAGLESADQFHSTWISLMNGREAPVK